jgi:hypothetical protein
MKYYDFEKAKETIKSYLKDNRGYGKLISASLGMQEDWFWTADTIWENGKFKRFTGKVAGINRSYWATPTLELEFEDEFSFRTPCYIAVTN